MAPAKSVMASMPAQAVSTSRVDDHGRVIKEVPRSGAMATPEKLPDASMVNLPGKTGWFAGQKPTEEVAKVTPQRDTGAEVDFKVGKSVVASK